MEMASPSLSRGGVISFALLGPSNAKFHLLLHTGSKDIVTEDCLSELLAVCT